MTVYVDDMKAVHTPKHVPRRYVMCHMIADTDEELHAMVAKIGVARKWFQGDHYDITLAKRALAVQNGAVEITWRQCGLMMGVKRRTGILPLPDNIEEIWKRVHDKNQVASGS